MALAPQSFTAKDFQDPASFNQFVNQLITEINRLGGSTGPVKMAGSIDMNGNPILNIGSPTTAADALSQTSADKLYGPDVVQKQMEATGTKMLQTARRLNDQDQQEKYSSYLNELGAHPQNTNGSTITAVEIDGSHTKLTVTAAVSSVADGSSLAYISRTDTVVHGTNSTYYYYLRKSDNTLQITKEFTDGDTSQNRMSANLDGRQFIAVAVMLAGGFQPAQSGAGGQAVPALGCAEVGSKLVFPEGSTVEMVVEPCNDWIEIHTEGGKQVNVARGTLISVFKRAEDLVPGDMIETENGCIDNLQALYLSNRESYKQRVIVKPGGTYFANGVKTHNAKLGCG